MKIKENEDQIFLREWITFALTNDLIKELRDNNKSIGDSKYLLSNMIAKYVTFHSKANLSKSAYKKMVNDGINFDEEHSRRKFYGKKTGYVYEHPIPVNIVRDKLLERKYSDSEIRNILSNAGNIWIITRQEDNRLNELKLTDCLPDGCKFDSPNSYKERYKSADIIDSRFQIKIKGAVVR